MSFPDVPNRLPREICCACLRPVEKGDALVQVFTVAGIGEWPGKGRAVFVADQFEAAHLRCTEPKIQLAFSKQARREKLKIGVPEPVDARCPDFQCLCCARILERGDRFLLVYRAEGVGRDPLTQHPGMSVTAGHETAHLDCSDPKKDRRDVLIVST